MGQTQLFLVVLGMMLIGVAIYVGISIFSANTIEDTRHAIIVDLGNFANRAVAYYWKPATQGGGGKSFGTITIGQVYPMAENVNARYFLKDIKDDEVTIVGIGKVVTTTGDSIEVQMKVTPQRNIVIIVH